MRELYSKKLTALKPYLGPKWMAKIAKELEIVDKQKVGYAFNGKLADESLVIKIYNKAYEIAKANIDLEKKLEAEHQALVAGGSVSS